jgi:hypothetical protein
MAREKIEEFYGKNHPKPRTGRDCKKTECERHKDYLSWTCGNSNLTFCMNCKHAHVSQYKKENRYE